MSCSVTYSRVRPGGYKGHSQFEGQGNTFCLLVRDFVNDIYVIVICLLAYTLSNSISIILLVT